MHIAIAGASGGIGAAMLYQLIERDDVQCIYATWMRTAPEQLNARIPHEHQQKIHWTQCDVREDAEVRAWCESMTSVDWMINCVGMLHDEQHGPEKSITALSPEHFAASMSVNCLPTLLMGKYAKPLLRKASQGVFATVSARVGSITDNRLGGWYSYRASKSALNMALKCLSIEWARSMKSVRVAALHPGTTDSELSKPFQKNVPEGKLFSAEKTAALLIEQIEKLHEQPTGRFIAYDGSEIPW